MLNEANPLTVMPLEKGGEECAEKDRERKRERERERGRDIRNVANAVKLQQV